MSRLPKTSSEQAIRPALAGASGHNPVLDGIRGLAILLVMWHHMTVIHPGNRVEGVYCEATEYGRCGVDLFFVLSGFLITGILYDSKQALLGKGGRYFTNFYARRTLRIFPLYYAVVAFSFLILPHVGEVVKSVVGPGSAELVQSKLDRFGGAKGYEGWFWLYLSNVPIARACSWLHGILGISWSLAIEEQFYLVWPMLVWFLDRKWAIRACWVIVGGALVIRCAMVTRLSMYGYGAEPRLPWVNSIGIYVLTFCRLDDLGYGALAALLLRGSVSVESAARVCKPVALICLPLAVVLGVTDARLGWSDASIGSNFGPMFQTAGYTLTGLGCAAGLVAAIGSRPGGAWNRFWSSGMMRVFGKYAYALYLFHLPIRAVIRDMLFGPRGAEGGGPRFGFPRIAGSELPAQMLFYVIAIAATLGAAWVSWVVFESQVLKLKRFFPSGVEKKV